MFEKLSIPEIQRALVHSQSQSQKVQQQLRKLVSLRYPDLLKSAGTVLDMKQRSNEIQTTLRSVPQLCNDIATHTWGISCHPKDPNHHPTRSPTSASPLASPLAPLAPLAPPPAPPPAPPSIQWTTYPEKIWNALDNQQFLQATTVLLAEAAAKSTTTLTASQRAQQRQFAQQIKRRAKRVLHTYEDNDTAIVIGALSTLVVFGDSMNDVLSILLIRRLSYIESCIQQKKKENRRKRKRSASNSSQNKGTALLPTQNIMQMTNMLNAINGTILLVQRGFVQRAILEALESIVKHLKMTALQDLFQTASRVIEEAKTTTTTSSSSTTTTTTTITPQECSATLTAWLNNIVTHINEQEDVLLPTSMSAHDVAVVQEALAKSTFALMNQVTPLLHSSSSSTTTTSATSATIHFNAAKDSSHQPHHNRNNNTTTLQLLYSNLFAKRGTVLLETALDAAITTYMEGIQAAMQRIDEASGQGAQALGDVSALSSSSSASAFSFSKKNKNAKKIRVHAAVESNWSLNCSQVLTMDLSTSLSSLLEDARRLSDIQHVPRDGGGGATPLNKIVASIALRWTTLHGRMQGMIQEDRLAAGGGQRTPPQLQRATMDHVLLLGACTSVLSTFQLGNGVDGATDKDTKRIMGEDRRHGFVQLTQQALQKWSTHVMNECCQTFQQNVCAMVENSGRGGVTKRYGWTKVSLNNSGGSVLEEEEDEDEEDQEDATVDMPTSCSPYIVEMLYAMHDILYHTSSLTWCGSSSGGDDVVPSKIMLKEMWTVIVRTLVEGKVGSSFSDVNEDKDILQCILDVSVLERLACSSLSFFGAPSSAARAEVHALVNRLKQLKTTMESKIDPVEWTLYESLFNHSIDTQMERMKFYTPVHRGGGGRRSGGGGGGGGGGNRSTSSMFNTYGYSDESVSQNILPMASTPGRFPLLPVARVVRKKSFGSLGSPRSGSPEQQQQQHSNAQTSSSGVTQAATTLFSSITTSFWGD